MTAGRWERIERLFHEIADLPPERRAAELDRVCAGDDALRAEVQALLDADRESPTAFHSAVAEEASRLLGGGEDPWTGSQVGAWRITKLLGSGGMGVVYLGERVDGRFEQQVAIKFLRQPLSAAADLARFRRERSILARLDHPNICRLLDGGEWRDPRGGPELPYLVLERVEGSPITEHAVRENLGRTDRLALFLQALEAVAYAHRKLVLHRDLKPQNILVTVGGAAKLLDFGIGKLLEDEEDGATVTAMAALTPEYASPEQIRGEPLSVATDIYSLGALLYELLSGGRPLTFRKTDSLETSRAICEVEPAPMGVDRDLDAIVAMALQKEPARRYASVDLFAADIRRYLGGRPVAARRVSAGYRLVKLARRHRGLAAATALAAVSLIAGTAVSVYQARRADRRFNEVRQIANRMLFELNQDLVDAPTKVRAALIGMATEYLDRLAQDSSGDVTLQSELVGGYEKVANLQGSAASANVGNSQSALASYRKAIGISERLVRRAPSGGNYTVLSRLYARASTLEDAQGNTRVAWVDAEKSEGAAREVARLDPNGWQAQSAAFRAAVRLGDLHRKQGEAQPALAAYRRAEEGCRTWIAARPTDANAISACDVAVTRLGNLELEIGELEQALAHFTASMAALVAAQEIAPTRELRRSIMVAHFSIGRVLGGNEQPNLLRDDEAIAHYRKTLEIAQGLAAEDPGDARSLADLAQGQINVATILRERDPASAAGLFREAAATFDGLLARDPKRLFYAALRGDALEGRAVALARLGRVAEAAPLADAAAAARRAIMARDPENKSYRADFTATRLAAAELEEARGRRVEAAAILRAILPEFRQMVADAPYRLAARNRLALTLMQLARVAPEEAGARYAEAVEEFRSWQREGKAAGYAGRRIEEIQARLRTAAGGGRARSQASEAPLRQSASAVQGRRGPGTPGSSGAGRPDR
jgi:tetratricopeptide (TPR) repeat protein